MSRKRPLSTPSNSICHWTNDDVLDTTKSQRTLNSFFVTGSRIRNHSSIATPPMALCHEQRPPMTPPTISPLSITQKVSTPPTRKKKQFKQVYLDCGQSVFGQELCQKCGTLYMPGIAQDMRMHATICRPYAQGVLWRSMQHQRVHSLAKDDSIVSVTVHKDMSACLEAVYQQVSQDLGMERTSLAGHTVWLYLRQQRVVGMVATKPITKAFRLVDVDEEIPLDDTEHGNSETSKPCATTNNSNLRVTSKRSTTRIIQKKIPTKSMLGIAILWTRENVRSQGIATRLVDTARQYAFFGMTVPLGQLAFSSPTEAGCQFANKYCQGPACIYDYSTSKQEQVNK